MAASGLPPEAVLPDIYYRCHPSRVNRTVVCMWCSNVYHKSDFNRKLESGKNVKYVECISVL